MTTGATISPEQAVTLAGLFRERVHQTPDAIAYRQYDIGRCEWTRTTWREMANEVGDWQAAMLREGLKPGDRVGIMLRNSREWIAFDQAALGLGLVTVPLYTEDRPENAAYIINDANIRLLLVEGKRQWQQLQTVKDEIQGLERIISVNTIEEEDGPADGRLESLSAWLFGVRGDLQAGESDADDLATIVYTSGTTGRPKGVMLSHHNILSNAYASSRCAPMSMEDVMLSFLPLSHTLERTAGYYMAMMVGIQVAYARSIPQLGEDLQAIRPTILVSVPRIYERVYGRILDGLKKKSPLAQRLFRRAVAVGWRRFQHHQGRAGWHPSLLTWPLLEKAVAHKILSRLGGRMRLAICGGAAMPPEVAKVFIGLGLPLFQGYGMTECSPVASVNHPDDNIPESIGLALEGVEVKVGERDELLVRGPNVMLGYWNNEQATKEAVDADGWLHTGDQARIDEGGHIYIIGRLKEIIVLANGEKVPPADMEMAITMDPLFEQVMIIGEGKPYLSALVVLDEDHWKEFAAGLDVDSHGAASLSDKYVEKAVLHRIAQAIDDFPGYAQVRRVTLSLTPWSIEDGLLTPTMKMKRARIENKYHEAIECMYEGHCA
ncbi:MAG: long-chain fatty acid--CoA ligase [Gammaproteobacteria bacterium]|jgi:long-chain acyl-CoA synthetase